MPEQPSANPLPEMAVDDVKVAKRRSYPGQALVEYVLILVLVSLAVIAILTVTGPAIGNLFSNTVTNLLQETTVPYSTLNPQQFWDYVTAVASYTPPAGTLAVNTVIATNTDAPSPTLTGTLPSKTPTPTATSDPTSGPSPTPIDAAYGLPFYDDGTGLTHNWHTPFLDAFAALPWNVNYYNSPSAWSGGTFTPNAPVFGSARPCISNPASAVPCAADVNFPYGGSVAPGPGINPTGFGAIFKGTAPFEGRAYQVVLIVGPNDHASFKIDGSIVATWNPGDPVPMQPVTVQPLATSAGTPIPHSIEVDYLASSTGSDKQKLKLVLSTLADYGNCGWLSYSPGRGDNASWQDSPGNQPYQLSSNCNIRLRGYIDLSTATSPIFTFEDQWTLSTNAVAQVGVRAYSFNAASPNDWVWITVHSPSTINANWQLEYLDLKNFAGTDFTTTPSKQIEIAYRVTNNDNTNNAAGWLVDNIRIAQNSLKSWVPPVLDDAEGTSQLTWIQNCDWRITQELTSPGSPTHIWSDSYNGNYLPNSDCALELNGVIDLTSFGGANPQVPQLQFWSNFTINGTTTQLTVEYSPFNNRSQWTALTPFGSSNPYIVKGNGGTQSSSGWVQQRFDLNALDGGKYYFRFRLNADPTSPSADGWYLDDISFQTRVQQVAQMPFIEPFPNLTNWTVSGNWGLTTTNPNDGQPHSSPYALTDSPNGTKYALNSNSYAQLTPQIDLSVASKPVLQFWSRWDTAANANLNLEISIDGGVTWAQIIWQHQYNNDIAPFFVLPGGASATNKYNTDTAWTRYKISLASFNTKLISLRFRLQEAGGATPADGWYVDDLSIQEDSPAVYAVSSPFKEDVEGGATNWNIGGNWTPTTTTAHAGTTSFAASNSAKYTNRADSILEPQKTFDLTSVANPVVSFWTKYGIYSLEHYVYVEIQQDGTNTWSTLNWLGPATNTATNASGNNLGWTRQLMSIPNSYYSGANKLVHIRFRLLALTSATPPGNWWLDDVYVGSLNSVPVSNNLAASGYNSYTVPYAESFSTAGNLPLYWVPEGNWQVVNDWSAYGFNFPADNFTPISHDYGGGTAHNQWDVNFYHYYANDPNITGTPIKGNVPAAQLCSPTHGNQISNPINVGGVPIQYSSSGVKFSYSNGTPNASASASKSGIQVTGLGHGFQFSVAADTTPRTLQVYVGAYFAQGTLTASLSDSYMLPYSNSSLNATSGGLNGLYTLVYKASSPNQVLTVNWSMSVDNGGGNVSIQAATVVLSGSPVAGGTMGSYATQAGATIDLTATGTADWAHWGLNTVTDFDSMICVKALMHSTVSLIKNVWGAGNVPGFGAAAPDATWVTDSGNNANNFTATYTRQMNVNAGTYRFWGAGDDGITLKVDGSIITPDTSLPYPWTSPGTTDWQDQGSTDYFYSVTIGTTGMHTFEVDYYQKGGGSLLDMQIGEKSNVLHSGPLGSNYTTNQDTGASLNGFIAVPPPGSLHTYLTFNERFIAGSNVSTPDMMYVEVSKDGGVTWTPVSVIDNAVDTSNNSTVGSSVNYGFNGNDAASSVNQATTYQNWHPCVVDLNTYLTPLASPQRLSIRFELNAINSTAPLDGWYIDNIQVFQQ